MVSFSEEAVLQHYGTPRRSGRYPYGSGGNDPGPGAGSQRNPNILNQIADLRKGGLTDTQIAEALGMSTTDFRAQRTIAKNEQRQANINQAQKLKDTGMSNRAIGAELGVNESVIRSWLAPGAAEKTDILISTAKELKSEVDSKQIIDIGAGVENHMGISKDKLNASIAILKQEGYTVHTVPVPQVGTKHDTKVRVLCPPETTQRDAFIMRDQIQQIDRFSIDGGRSFSKSHPPIPVNPDRLKVRWAEEGGTNADGVVYIRPGVEDLSLGGARYAQVRVQVGDKHYIKGMAVYKDDLPPGVDLMFNTNKSKAETPTKLDALKELNAPDSGKLPFGAVTRQLLKNEGTGDEAPYSAMNIVRAEGEWESWSKSLASQMLSKQSLPLIRSQLAKTYEAREKEYDEIMALTNPVVKKKLLEKFATTVDGAAVHLDAAAINAKQAWHVILPVENMKPNEVYAPNYENGTRVALIRYPHGGTFEIPELIVNNGQRTAKSALGAVKDAIGIAPAVAERLSGADFDGDTVIVIPNNSGKVKSTPALKDLENFDPRTQYKAYPGMKRMRDYAKPGLLEQQEMGGVSNLITDMTIRGAPPEHIARAVKHSMVVIDAHKHDLNYKQSAIDNNIKALKEQYQGAPTRAAGGTGSGASTLISKATSKIRVEEMKLRSMKDGGPIDPKTGEEVWVPSGKTRMGKDGIRRPTTVEKKRLALTTDAHSLSSGTPVEKLYGDHSNKLKGLANKVRLDALATPSAPWSPSAKKVYAKEVASLDSKLHRAQLNAPRERQAQIIANAEIRAKRAANPNLDKEALQKASYQALETARLRTGAGKERVKFTPEEWEAVQAGAISSSKLKALLDNADVNEVKKLATPRSQILMSGAKLTKAKAMLASGSYTRAEIAAALGVSLTTLDNATVG